MNEIIDDIDQSPYDEESIENEKDNQYIYSDETENIE